MAASTVFPLAAVLLAVAAVAVVAVLYVRDLREGEAAKHRVDRAIDQLSQDVSFANVLEYNRSELEQWHLQSRARARWSLIASLVAMFAGLGLLGIGLYYAMHNPDRTSQVVVAALTAIGGTLTSYISKTFLETNRQTEEELRFFFSQSVAASFFLTAERLAHELEEDAKKETVQHIIQEVLAAAGHAENQPTGRVRKAGARFRHVAGGEG